MKNKKLLFAIAAVVLLAIILLIWSPWSGKAPAEESTDPAEESGDTPDETEPADKEAGDPAAPSAQPDQTDAGDEKAPTTDSNVEDLQPGDEDESVIEVPEGQDSGGL